jgi:hypothetical protein
MKQAVNDVMSIVPKSFRRDPGVTKKLAGLGVQPVVALHHLQIV